MEPSQPALPTAEAPALPRRTLPRWARRAGWVLATGAFLYGMVGWDVVQRAKESYLEGEKYMRWAEHPEEKKADLDAKFEKAKAQLDKQRAANKIVQDEYDRQLEIAQFDRDFQMRESSLKYATIWYQTAYELFSPPESRWVRLAREKAPLAKEKWKEELRAQHVPFEDYMLE